MATETKQQFLLVKLLKCKNKEALEEMVCMTLEPVEVEEGQTRNAMLPS